MSLIPEPRPDPSGPSTVSVGQIDDRSPIANRDNACRNNGRYTDLGVPRLTPPRRRLTAAGTETIRIVSKCSGATRVCLSPRGKHPLNPFGQTHWHPLAGQQSAGPRSVSKLSVQVNSSVFARLPRVAVDSGHPGGQRQAFPVVEETEPAVGLQATLRLPERQLCVVGGRLGKLLPACLRGCSVPCRDVSREGHDFRVDAHHGVTCDGSGAEAGGEDPGGLL